MGKPRKRVASADVLLRRVLKSRSYRGKHVILVHGRAYAASSEAELRQLFDKLTEEFPSETPTLAYVPEADSLVLRFR